MADTLFNNIQLRRLILTAEELKQLSGWPSQVVEDYLAAVETIISIAESLDTNNDNTDQLLAGEGGDNAQIAVRRVDDLDENNPGIKRLDDPELQVAPQNRQQEQQECSQCQLRRQEHDEQVSVTPARLNRLTIGEITFSTLKTDGLATNTNVPGGATAYQLAVKDETDTIVGYIPLYGSPW